MPITQNFESFGNKKGILSKKAHTHAIIDCKKGLLLIINNNSK